MSPQSWGVLLTALAAVAVYVNTIPADFAFDDNFAVVSCIGGCCYGPVGVSAPPAPWRLRPPAAAAALPRYPAPFQTLSGP